MADVELLPVTQEDREAADSLFTLVTRGKATAEDFRHRFARHRIAAESRQSAPSTASGVEELVKPWADFHGELPDYDHPLRPVYESGIQYVVELLAKMLGVAEYEICEGTEEFDGDLGGTLVNIVLAAMPKDEHGDPVYPCELPSILTRAALITLTTPAKPAEGLEERAREIARRYDIDGYSGFEEEIMPALAEALASPSGERDAGLEEAAKVAEAHADDRGGRSRPFDWHDGYMDACRNAATAIRNLKGSRHG